MNPVPFLDEEVDGIEGLAAKMGTKLVNEILFIDKCQV